MKLFLIPLALFTLTAHAAELPPNFVYLRDVDSSIVQDMRYTTTHNFIGHPIAGYFAAQCILTKPAAIALSNVQKALKPQHLSLKVYDCYRPQKAVDEFMRWGKQLDQQQMKAEFYPRVDKSELFKRGYIAEKSGHTRGSTMDLTIVPLPTPTQPPFSAGQKLIACTAATTERFADNSIDMGTGYDCMDEYSHNDHTANISKLAFDNRMHLKTLMEQNGFLAYQPEWWHFTLKDELYPDTYFNFDIN